VWRIDIDNAALCLTVFKSNRDAGLILFGAMLLDAAMRAT
jgi:4-hydroxybenzoate polyprenyltransferase